MVTTRPLVLTAVSITYVSRQLANLIVCDGDRRLYKVSGVSSNMLLQELIGRNSVVPAHILEGAEISPFDGILLPARHTAGLTHSSRAY